MVHFFIALSRWLDRFVAAIGRQVAWLALVLVLVMFAVVVLRYGFDLGWIALQESTIYFHAMVFLVGIAYTLQQEEHVRVDIVYQKLSQRGQAWVDLFGTIFLLLPVTVFILWVSQDYINIAFEMREQSQEAGGLPWVYVLKGFIHVMTLLLLLQGMSNLIKISAFLRGYLDGYKVNKDQNYPISSLFSTWLSWFNTFVKRGN